jgi:hypothetical protein
MCPAILVGLSASWHLRDPALEGQCKNPITPLFPSVVARNNRSFDCFVIGEKEEREEKPGGEPASAECYCTKLKCVCKLFKINEILVEATGVELMTMLTARKLLILGTATTAKKTPLPDPLYVYCTKNPFRSGVQRTALADAVSHRFSEMDRKSPSFVR